MLTDHWVIILLLSQFCVWLLLLKGGISAVQLLRRWNAQVFDERQLALERQTYLISSILQLSLGFQLLGLVVFLATVNLHLPGMLKGAMCATGVLGMGTGYLLLGIKLLALPIYAVFLSLNYFDGQSPHYPLTPIKYWWVFPALLLLSVDLGMSAHYFSQLSPNIIATCCSVEFSGKSATGLDAVAGGGIPWGALGISWALALALFTFLKNSRFAGLSMLLGFGFAAIQTWLLKFFYVKYIYGLPSHACLFDIFFSKYYYVGYAIYGSMLLLIFALVSKASLFYMRGRLPQETQNLHLPLQRVAFVALTVALLLPMLYWLLWRGEL